MHRCRNAHKRTLQKPALPIEMQNKRIKLLQIIALRIPQRLGSIKPIRKPDAVQIRLHLHRVFDLGVAFHRRPHERANVGLPFEMLRVGDREDLDGSVERGFGGASDGGEGAGHEFFDPFFVRVLGSLAGVSGLVVS